MKITRRRVLGLTGAAAALVLPVAAQADAPASETFTLIRAGDATIIRDASGADVYLRAGSTEIAHGSAARLGAFLTAVQAHPEQGVSEIRLPARERRG